LPGTNITWYIIGFLFNRSYSTAPIPPLLPKGIYLYEDLELNHYQGATYINIQTDLTDEELKKRLEGTDFRY